MASAPPLPGRRSRQEARGAEGWRPWRAHSVSLRHADHKKIFADGGDAGPKLARSSSGCRTSWKSTNAPAHRQGGWPQAVASPPVHRAHFLLVAPSWLRPLGCAALRRLIAQTQARAMIAGGFAELANAEAADGGGALIYRASVRLKHEVLDSVRGCDPPGDMGISLNGVPATPMLVAAEIGELSTVFPDYCASSSLRRYGLASFQAGQLCACPPDDHRISGDL